MKYATLGLILCVCAAAGAGQGDDWKVYDFTKKDPFTVYFYLNSEIKRTPTGTIKVWTKSIRADDMWKATPSPDDPSAKAGIDKAKAGYRPPILGPLQKPEGDAFVMTLLWEQLADDANLPIQSRILWEINCEELESRALSVQVGEKLSQQPTNWAPIAPETVMRTLAKFACPKK